MAKIFFQKIYDCFMFVLIKITSYIIENFIIPYPSPKLFK
ncbi:hypothetical protein SPAR69_0374 [Streptococcus pneumoniae GA41317]|nr:hypothetical protein SPAR69_0374 [Streptococcus pneumoniae GA41317]